jgi:hypothetical protein
LIYLAANKSPEAPLAAARPELPWLQPIPDALVSAGFADPGEIVEPGRAYGWPWALHDRL